MALRWRLFGDVWVLYFQRAARSTFQTCILYSHQGHTMCRSMVDIKYATAEIMPGKKKRTNDRMKYIIWPAPLHRAAINNVQRTSNIFTSFNRFVCLFVCSVCLLATLRKNFWTDLHDIFMEGWQWANEQMVKFWWWSGSGIRIRIRMHAVTLNCTETLQLSNYILTQYFDCIMTSLK